MNRSHRRRPPMAAACALALVAAHPAAAQIQVQVNGSPVQFGAVPPQKIGGRVLIPLRAVVEALGADIKWDATTQTVRGSKGPQEFSLQINSRNASVNGTASTLDVPAQLIRGATMVPLRFVAEALGAEVEWNAATQQVAINARAGGGEEAPAVGRISGEVMSVRPNDNPPTVTVRANGVRNTYRIAPDTIVLRGEEGQRGTPVDLDQIRAGDNVRLRVDPTTGLAEVVEAVLPRGGDTRPPVVAGRATGEVEEVRRVGNRRMVTVRTATGRTTYEVPEDADVLRATGGRPSRRADIGDIQIGDRVDIQADRGGIVSRLEASARDADPRPGANNGITGEVTAVRSQGATRTVTVRTNSGRVVYDVPEDAVISRGAAGRAAARAELSDIRVGDQVRLTADRNGVASRIDATGVAANTIPTVNGRVSGEVVAIHPEGDPPTITVRSGTTRATFDLSRNTVIQRGIGNGALARASINDVEPGDRVSIRLDPDGNLAELVDVRHPVEAADPVAAQDLRITSFTHNATGMLRAGSQVQVTLVGTPGATASFDAGTLARNVALTEDRARPGRYTGAFTVPQGATAKDVTVTGQLRVGNRVAPLVQAGQALEVDSQPPVISDAAPADRGETTNQQPDIYLEVSDGGGSGVDVDSLRMVVGNRDVTDQVKATKRFFIYTPRTPFAPGQVPVAVTIKDMAGNTTQANWAFTVRPAPAAIQSVTHNADKPLAAGDVLTVTVKGQTKGQGTFSVGDAVQNVPLVEQTPGVYVGRYTVRRGDQISKAPVVVNFQSPEGTRITQEATAPVNILTREAVAPTITTPRDMVRLGEELIVEGTATPGSRVVVEVSYRGRAFGALALKGTLGTQEATVDRRGNWATPPFEARLPLGVRRPELIIRAVSVDAAGQESEATVATLQTR